MGKFLLASMSVWSDKSYSVWANKRMSAKGNRQPCKSTTTSGAFGSQSKFGNSGSSSLPPLDLGRKKSNLYEFELSSNHSTSYCSLSFGTEAKPYGWTNNLSPFMSSGWNLSSKKTSWTNMSLSGGSSRCSSGNVSMDWNTTVDGVFLEEIRRMSKNFNK